MAVQLITALNKAGKKAAKKTSFDGDNIEKGGKGLLFGVLAVGLGVGIIWLGKKYLGAIIDDSREQRCLDDILINGTPCNYADRLYTAIDGWGTNEEEIFEVMELIPNKRFYDQVALAYRDLTRGDNLNEDLKDDLRESEFKRIQQIINSKPN